MNTLQLEAAQVVLQPVDQDKLEHQVELAKTVLQDTLPTVVTILDVCHVRQDGNVIAIRLLLQNVQTMSTHTG